MAKKEKKSNKDNKHFFKDFKAEVKKVIWPTPKQLLNNTIAIVVIVIVVGVIVFTLDLAFDAVNKYGLTNLQKTVQSTQNENTTTDSSEGETKVETTDNTSSEEQTNNTATE